MVLTNFFLKAGWGRKLRLSSLVMIFFSILLGLKISSDGTSVYKEPVFSIPKVGRKNKVVSFKWGSHPDLKNGSLLVKCCLFRCDFLKHVLLVLYEAV